jgi:acyl dehydratase
MAGTVAVLAAPFVSGWLALAGVAGMFVAMAAQGRGHGFEHTKPAPFRSRLDVVLRIFAEQWITFPRFVLSGGLSRAPSTR